MTVGPWLPQCTRLGCIEMVNSRPGACHQVVAESVNLSGHHGVVFTEWWLLSPGGVDPGCGWQFRRDGCHADEALGAGAVGGGQGLGTPGLDGCGPAEPAVAVLVVVPGEEVLAVRPGGFDRGEPGGEGGRYFSVLNCASEYGLSLDTWGREWDWVTPRSAN